MQAKCWDMLRDRRKEWNIVLLSSSQNKPTLQNKLLQESSVADATFSLTRYYE